MDVQTLITQAQRVAGRVDPGFDARTLMYLNEAVERWADARPWDTLHQIVTLTCDGTKHLVFPDYARVIRWITDQTNKSYLDPVKRPDRQFTSEYLSDTAGSPDFWREVGIEPVYRQPAAVAPLVFTTTVSDSWSMHIQGLGQDTTQSGYAGQFFMLEEVLSCSGSGASNVSANSYVKVVSVGKSKQTNGDVTVLSGGTKIGRIAANRYSTPYRKIELLRIPPAGTILQCGILMRPPPLTAVTHVPHPSISPHYLIWYAAGLIHKSMNEADLGELCLARAEQILKERDTVEKSHGDKDWGAMPDPNYWGSEDLQSWPQ